jgi:hypothetical protein
VKGDSNATSFIARLQLCTNIQNYLLRMHSTKIHLK